MTLEEMKQELEAVNKPALLEAMMELINAERQKGIEEVSKRNKEAQNLRKYKKALEAAGLSEDDDIEDFLSKKTNKTEDSLTLKSLKMELDRVKQERDNERLQSKKKTLQAELTNALGDKVYGSKYLINSLINEGSVDIIDGEIIVKRGDEHLSFDEGIKVILDSNKDMLRTNVVGGSKTVKSDSKPTNLETIIKSNDPDAIKANFAEIAKEIGLKL